MIQRTESEMKAYVDGYNACFNQFIENLKGINENPLYKIISNMHVMRAAVNAVVESEEDMPNSLKCKIKHLCHNRTITESERDRILKALDQESCEDAVSRQSVKEQMIYYGFHAPDMTVTEFIEDCLSPVNSQKIGHWIRVDDTKMKCSNCDIIHLIAQYPRVGINYCPNCGSKMVEPQESED